MVVTFLGKVKVCNNFGTQGFWYSFCAGFSLIKKNRFRNGEGILSCCICQLHLWCLVSQNTVVLVASLHHVLLMLTTSMVNLKEPQPKLKITFWIEKNTLRHILKQKIFDAFYCEPCFLKNVRGQLFKMSKFGIFTFKTARLETPYFVKNVFFMQFSFISKGKTL